MKSKKFLIFYFTFIFSFFILKTASGLEEVKRYPKIIIIILTDEIEPMGRVICQSVNRTIIYEWKSANNAYLELKELKERYGDSKNYYLFIQYDKWPY